ncbi:MAG: hypothetical protein C0489_05270 [Candidatus Accumulibacter sp.]|nr:hypothetical protein [Accumulibacter sp.]
MSTQSKAKRYVSLGFDELDQLQELGWGERAMYLELKRLANFKTGKVGVFRSQALTWEELGRRVSVPSAQGRAAKLVDGKEAALMVGRLEAAGLVSDQGRRENKGLTLMLPLSPIGSASAVAEPAKAAQQASTPTESATQPIAKARPDVQEDDETSAEVITEDWGNEDLEIQSGAGLGEEESGAFPENTAQPFAGAQQDGPEHVEPTPAVEVDWEEEDFPLEDRGNAEVVGAASEKDAGNPPDSREGAGSPPARMPDGRNDEILENLCSTRLPEANEGDDSVMTPFNKKSSFETEPRAGDTPAPCPPQASIPTPSPSEKAPGAVRASLTLADIRSRLAAAGFIYLTTPDSKTLMQGWIDRGISLEMFEKAMGIVKKGKRQLAPRAFNQCLVELEVKGKQRAKAAL